MAIDVSLYDGLSAVAGIAVSVASFGTATPIVAAAIMGGIAMAHSTANLATGHLNIDQWGTEMITSGVTALTSIATAGMGNGLGDIILKQAINSGSSLLTSGITIGPNGIDWQMSEQGWQQWGAGAISGMVGGVLTSGPLNIGGALGDTIGGGALGNALGQGVNGFINNSLSQGINMAFDSSLQFDWGSAGRSLAVGSVTGFASGLASSAMGGTWQNGYSDKKGYHAGGYRFKDLDSQNLFYSAKLNNASSVVGSFLGEWTDKALGGSFDLNFGDYMGMHWGTNGVSMDHNASGFSVGNALKAFGDRRAIRTHVQNMNDYKGMSTLTYMNTGYLSGDKNAQKTALDILFGRKTVEYDLEHDRFEKNYGHADRDGTKIHLNKDAILQSGDAGMRQKMAMWSGMMTREGALLDQWNKYEQEGGSWETSSEQKRIDMEHEATIKQLNAMINTQKELGLNVGGNTEYQEVVGKLARFALTGDPGDMDVSGGRELSIVKSSIAKKYIIAKYGKYMSENDIKRFKNEGVIHFDENKLDDEFRNSDIYKSSIDMDNNYLYTFEKEQYAGFDYVGLNFRKTEFTSGMYQEDRESRLYLMKHYARILAYSKSGNKKKEMVEGFKVLEDYTDAEMFEMMANNSVRLNSEVIYSKGKVQVLDDLLLTIGSSQYSLSKKLYPNEFLENGNSQFQLRLGSFGQIGFSPNLKEFFPGENDPNNVQHHLLALYLGYTRSVDAYYPAWKHEFLDLHIGGFRIGNDVNGTLQDWESSKRAVGLGLGLRYNYFDMGLLGGYIYNNVTTFNPDQYFEENVSSW